LLIGGAFVAVYGVVEMVTYVQTGGGHAFSGLGIETGTLLPWQDLIYFSYVALTTLGFGDMSPTTMWARSVAITEGIVGVLYVTIIMARLVSLYVTREQTGS
jgi:hypothetical protein